MADVEPISELQLLTEKEREALDFVLQRLSSKEIALTLGVSPKAIDKRLDSARIKLSVSTRHAAANRYAELCGRWERLPYQPFLLGNENQADASPGRVPAEALYTLGDATTFGSSVPWMGGEPVRRAPEFLASRLNSLPRLVLIVAGAVLLLVLVSLGLDVKDGLKELIHR